MSHPCYELDEPLGEGGFGSVYRAVHHPTGLPVAIKLLRRADPEMARMLLAEAAALAKVRHPNVAQLLDVGRTDAGLGFLVMELVKGHDIERWLDAWPGWARFSRALLETLDGLGAAHAAGVVHRDLKPPNMLLDDRDGALRLVDFGVARVLDPLLDSSHDVVAGTPEFMAPEQLGGLRSIGPSADLYAFGVLLHHVIRGQGPFDDAMPLPLLLEAKQRFTTSPDRMTRPGLLVPDAMHALIDRLLQPEARDRPRFAARVRAELEAIAAQVVDSVDRGTPISRPPTRDVPTVNASGGIASPLGDRSAPSPRAASSPERGTRLAAPDDPSLGAALVRLREHPLVGRDAERDRLLGAIHDVRLRGDVRLMVLLGEPGIGKSRLARWGLAEVERHGWMQSSAVAYELDGIGMSGGLGHLLHRLIGAPDRDARSYAWLTERDPAIDVGRLHAFLAPTGATLPSRAQVLDLTRRILRVVARITPLYLWIDDLGWAHDGATELVESLVAEGGAPILVVATMRASTAAHTAVRRRLAGSLASERTDVLTLGPLDLSARRELLRRVAPLSLSLADAMAVSIEGSPLALVQLVHDWIEAGLLVPSPTGLSLAPGRSLSSVIAERPPTRALDARIERLLASFAPRIQQAEGVLLRAALLGASFEESTLAAAVSDDTVRSLIPEVLDRAILAGLLRAEDGSLAFEHGLSQENLTSRLEAREDKRAILFDTANGLQAAFGKDRADVAFAVALLLRRAGRGDAAWDRLLHAIDRAAWNGDIATAQRYLDTAHAWEAGDVGAGQPSRRGAIAFAVGRTHYMASRYPEALEALTEARALAERDGEPVTIARCIAALADVAFFADRYAEAETLASEALTATRDLDDPDAATVAQVSAHRLSEISFLRGDGEAAYAFQLECRDHARRGASPARERTAILGLAELAASTRRIPEARAAVASLRRAAEGAGDVDHLQHALEMDAFVDLFEGAPSARARALLEARLRAVEAVGERWRITGLKIALALCIALERGGGPERVEAACLDMLDAFDAVPHDGPRERHALEHLVRVLREQERPELAAAVEERIARRAAVFYAALAVP